MMTLDQLNTISATEAEAGVAQMLRFKTLGE
jgi:hypothetical protein